MEIMNCTSELNPRNMRIMDTELMNAKSEGAQTPDYC
jgi:hypothetical protein